MSRKHWPLLLQVLLFLLVTLLGIATGNLNRDTGAFRGCWRSCGSSRCHWPVSRSY
jgi:hypothetical protein